jgi:hypothetical protein
VSGVMPVLIIAIRLYDDKKGIEGAIAGWGKGEYFIP